MSMRGATRIDMLVWVGWLLLLAGMAVVGFQAMSGVAIEWCVSLKLCSMQVDPKLYRDVYGLVLVGTGAVTLIAAAVIDHVPVHLAAQPDPAAAAARQPQSPA